MVPVLFPRAMVLGFVVAGFASYKADHTVCACVCVCVCVCVCACGCVCVCLRKVTLPRSTLRAATAA